MRPRLARRNRSGLRDQAGVLVEIVRQVTSLIQEELATLVSEGTNRSLFILTVVTVLALPFNVVGSLLGMNVGGIPFGESRAGFAIIVFSSSR